MCVCLSACACVYSWSIRGIQGRVEIVETSDTPTLPYTLPQTVCVCVCCRVGWGQRGQSWWRVPNPDPSYHGDRCSSTTFQPPRRRNANNLEIWTLYYPHLFISLILLAPLSHKTYLSPSNHLSPIFFPWSLPPLFSTLLFLSLVPSLNISLLWLMGLPLE